MSYGLGLGYMFTNSLDTRAGQGGISIAKNEFTTSFGDDRNFDKLFTEPANFDNKTGANFRVTI